MSACSVQSVGPNGDAGTPSITRNHICTIKPKPCFTQLLQRFVGVDAMISVIAHEVTEALTDTYGSSVTWINYSRLKGSTETVQSIITFAMIFGSIDGRSIR